MNGRYIFGIILVILGGLLVLNNFGLMDFSDTFGTWWPLLIIAYGIYIISKSKHTIFFGVLILLVGIMIQFSKLGMISVNFWDILWPTMLILFGIKMISGKTFRKHLKPVNDDQLDVNSFFSGYKELISSPDFKGGSITTVFGGADIDLMDSGIENGYCELELTALFGGIELRVPRNWKVETKGVPFFGGCSNKTRPILDNDDNPVLKVNYFVMFGGIDIK